MAALLALLVFTPARAEAPPEPAGVAAPALDLSPPKTSAELFQDQLALDRLERRAGFARGASLAPGIWLLGVDLLVLRATLDPDLFVTPTERRRETAAVVGGIAIDAAIGGAIAWGGRRWAARLDDDRAAREAAYLEDWARYEAATAPETP